MIRRRRVLLPGQVSVGRLDVVLLESGDHGAVEQAVPCHHPLHHGVVVLCKSSSGKFQPKLPVLEINLTLSLSKRTKNRPEFIRKG